MSAAIPSSRSKYLRACLLCSIVMTPAEFKRDGCPNCEQIVGMTNSGSRVSECTSAQFDGVIAITDPDGSWVARWQRVNRYVKGIYAARVTGRPPQDVLETIEASGMIYRPRDQSED